MNIKPINLPIIFSVIDLVTLFDIELRNIKLGPVQNSPVNLYFDFAGVLVWIPLMNISNSEKRSRKVKSNSPFKFVRYSINDINMNNNMQTFPLILWIQITLSKHFSGTIKWVNNYFQYHISHVSIKNIM